jgi:ribonuclease HII
MLKQYYQKHLVESGCDEAGRGCLAGPVFAAAVILPPDFKNELLNDSKKLSKEVRHKLRPIIEKEALGWAVASATHEEIDSINILNASFLAMHRAVRQLKIAPELLLIDGNRFKKFPGINHQCVIGGDGIYMSIAAASVLAKTYRDDFMDALDADFPIYNWKNNKGYGTLQHRKAIIAYGLSPFHRKTFSVSESQLKFEFEK